MSFQIGVAMISDKYVGFIFNYNNATGDDILRLIDLIIEIVFEEYDITLKVEQ